MLWKTDAHASKKLKEPIEWRKYLQIICMGLVSRTYKALLQLSNKKKNSQIKNLVKDLKRLFSKEGMQMASKHMKRGSTSLVIRQMQIKTTVKCHFTPSWMALAIQKYHLLCIYPKELKTGTHIGTHTQMLIEGLFTAAKRWEQSEYSSDEWTSEI